MIMFHSYSNLTINTMCNWNSVIMWSNITRLKLFWGFCGFSQCLQTDSSKQATCRSLSILTYLPNKIILRIISRYTCYAVETLSLNNNWSILSCEEEKKIPPYGCSIWNVDCKPSPLLGWSKTITRGISQKEQLYDLNVHELQLLIKNR